MNKKDRDLPDTSQPNNTSQNLQPLTPELLIRVLSDDCQLQAQAAMEKLREVIERFRAHDPLAAVGAFEETVEIVLFLDTALKRLAAIAQTC